MGRGNKEKHVGSAAGKGSIQSRLCWSNFQMRHLLLLALVCSMSTSEWAGSGPKDGTILIIRHGEKTGEKDDIGLSKAGAKRAQDYASYFTSTRIQGESITPDFLFASAESKHSDRPRLTLVPLSQKLHEKIVVKFDEKDTTGIAKELRSAKYDGKKTLICWHHGEIPNLLTEFGVDAQRLLGPGGWPDDVFCWMVILHFGHGGALKAVSVVNEHLEKGDAMYPYPPQR